MAKHMNLTYNFYYEYVQKYIYVFYFLFRIITLTYGNFLCFFFSVLRYFFIYFFILFVKIYVDVNNTRKLIHLNANADFYHSISNKLFNLFYKYIIKWNIPFLNERKVRKFVYKFALLQVV